MSHFIEQCVERYLFLAPAGTKLKKVSTPFVPEDAGVRESSLPVKGADLVQCTWCAHTFPAADGRQLFQCGGSKPSPDAASRETSEAGELAGSAAKILMKTLYAAGVARWDVPGAVNHLACFFTKGTTECDRKLHRLFCYLS